MNPGLKERATALYRCAAVLCILAAPASAADSTQHLRDLSHAFRMAYEQIRPAVALITITRQRRFALPQSHPEIPHEAGLGSGTVVSADGYILSNYHVISAADSILVTLADRRTFTAEVVGFDSLIDIALLKIDAQQLPHAYLGDSNSLQIGDWVLAIGHPLGMGSTLTHGIVSALDRRADIFGGSGYAIENFIQTDAVINPGNSGGPLLNLDGETVGIVTAISTRTGYYMGYSLAVPINLAREAMNDILIHGHVVRGYMGVSMDPVTQESVRRDGLKMEYPHGVYIKVRPNSPAARAGLKDGDVVLAVDGQKVDHPNQIQSLIYGRDPGEIVQLTLFGADGQDTQLEIVLGEREEDRLLTQGRQRLSHLGLSVERLPSEVAEELGFTLEIAEELGFDPGEIPVIVTEVDPLGPAADKGIRVRDVITEIDQQRVTSMHQFVRSISNLEEGRSALFWFWRAESGIDVRALRISQ